MENLTCKGLSAAHRRMLIKCITEEIGSIPEPVEIEFMEPIRRKQYSSLWYGGQIAAIRVHGCVFEVHALGDVYAWLYDKSDRDRELLYVKDKNNSGRFGSDIQPYLKTDRALVAAICRKHNRYWIDMEHNNWWECSVYTPDGVFHDLMWVLDSDHIFAGIREVFCHMDAVLKDLGVPAGNEGSEVSSCAVFEFPGVGICTGMWM